MDTRDIIMLVRASAFTLLAWDIWENAGLDYLILRRFPMRLPMFVYLLCRATTLIYLGVPLASFANPSNAPLTCFYIDTLTKGFYGAAQSSTLFLFFLRLRGVYASKGPVPRWFLSFWGFLVFVPSMVPIILNVYFGPSPEQSRHSTLPRLCSATPAGHAGYTLFISPFLAPLIYDTAVFLAIGRRLIMMVESAEILTRQRPCIYGMMLLAKSKGEAGTMLARGLYRDGQKYYLISVALTMLGFAILLAASPVMLHHGYAATPCFAITHIYTCRVFRHTKLGIFREDPTVPPSASRLEEWERRNEAVSIAFVRDQAETAGISQPHVQASLPAQVGNASSSMVG